jgi:hypothetical protein
MAYGKAEPLSSGHAGAVAGTRKVLRREGEPSGVFIMTNTPDGSPPLRIISCDRDPPPGAR